MRRRIVREPEEKKPSVVAKGERVAIPHDPTNEAVVIAAAAREPDILESLWRKVRPDHFVQREHQEAWTALLEMRRRKLDFHPAVFAQIAGDEIKDYVWQLLEEYAEAPPNIEWHVETLQWDAARVASARGPVPSFLEALRDPKAEPDRVRALARQVAMSFDGHKDKKYLHEPDQLVREQMKEIEQRVSGHACFSYGIAGLDWYDKDIEGQRRRRMIPGPAPGQITVITGISGGGKSTMTANMVLGMAGWDFERQVFAEQGRKVLYGSWEMRGGMTLELMACISLGWSRSKLMEGEGPIATYEGKVLIQERMHELSKRVRFFANPFRRRRGKKITNDDNLDIIESHIADSGCEVFVADLWKRCLRDASPEAEEDALIQQQAMCEELRVHGILLQQQRLKDIEQRPDKRPTREGIKGSGAWIEIADTVIAPHRPALFKRMEDDIIEAIVLKQRYGKWPLVVEFQWDPDTGSIRGGRSVEYERPGEVNDIDGAMNDFLGQRGSRRRQKHP